MIDSYHLDDTGVSESVEVRSMGDGMFTLSQDPEDAKSVQTIILSLGQLKGLEGAVRASMEA